MDKSKIMEAYGEACVALEIAQNRHAEAKKAVIEFMNQPAKAETCSTTGQTEK